MPYQKVPSLKDLGPIHSNAQMLDSVGNKKTTKHFMDAWWELYPKDYNTYYAREDGKTTPMITAFLTYQPGQGRKMGSYNNKVYKILELTNKKITNSKRPKTRGK